MTLVELNNKIDRTEKLLDQMMTQWGICEATVLHKIIGDLRKELEVLYGERKRRQERNRRVRVK
jgi:hypothetical protein